MVVLDDEHSEPAEWQRRCHAILLSPSHATPALARRMSAARALDRFAQKSSGLRRRVDPLRDDPSTLLLRRASRRWLFDDPYGSRARTVFMSDSSAGRIDSAGLPLGASSDNATVWLPDFATRNATLP